MTFFLDSIFGQDAGHVTGYLVPARQTAIGTSLCLRFRIWAWQSSIMTLHSSKRKIVTSASIPVVNDPIWSESPYAFAGVIVEARMISTSGIPRR